MDELNLVTEHAASKRLGISKRKLWQMNRDGEIPCVRLGRRKLYDVRDLEQLIIANKEGARSNG